MTKFKNPHIKERYRVCGRLFVAEMLEKHIEDIHAWRWADSGSTDEESDELDSDEDYDDLVYEPGTVVSTYDSMDGSKYWGFPSRDYGSQYGSYPVHDDHGDESDPDFRTSHNNYVQA